LLRAGRVIASWIDNADDHPTLTSIETLAKAEKSPEFRSLFGNGPIGELLGIQEK
jgi:hypothetical protein